MLEISELLKNCKVIHIGSSDIKDGDILVFLMEDPSALEVVVLKDVLSNIVQLSKCKFMVWRNSLVDIKIMSRQEIVALRDGLNDVIEGKNG